MFGRVVRGSVLVGLLVLPPASAVADGPPERYSYDTGLVPSEFWSDLCGVPIGYRSRGTSLSVALENGGYRVHNTSEESFTNLITGQTVTIGTKTHTRGTFEPWIDEWGGQGWIFTHVVTGTLMRVHIPGPGTVVLQSGRMTQTTVIDSLGRTISAETEFQGRFDEVPADLVSQIAAGLLL